VAKAAAEYSQDFHLKLLKTFTPHTRTVVLETLGELHQRIQKVRRELKKA
jgi:hypothetical protein